MYVPSFQKVSLRAIEGSACLPAGRKQSPLESIGDCFVAQFAPSNVEALLAMTQGDGMRRNQAKLITCDACRGDCCTAIAVEIPKPRTAKDYEDVRWYLYHRGTHVYIDRDGDWIAEMALPCRHRDPRSGRCRIYAHRPPVCREAPQEECERNCEDARVRFRTAAEYDRWLGRRSRAHRRKHAAK